MALISNQLLILKTFKKDSEIFLHISLAYIFSLIRLTCGEINIDVICTIIKVINVVKTSILSTEIVKYVKGPGNKSLIHFCQSSGVYQAPGPLILFRVFVTSS